MNRIKRIKNFIEDYKTLDPNIKHLIKDSYEYYQKELMKQYLILSKHPFPQEHLSN